MKRLLCCSALLIVCAGCTDHGSDHPQADDSTRQNEPDFTRFPIVFECGKTITRTSADAVYPGFSEYLAALETQSELPLLDRIQRFSPFSGFPKTHFRDPSAPLSRDATLDWGPFQALLVSRGGCQCQLLLGTRRGRYHLLLVDTMSDLGGEISLAKVQGQTVLTYHAGISGTGHFSINGCFVLDRQGTPTVIEVDSVVRQAVATALPPDRRVVKGGGFKLEKLRFVHAVSKPGDGNAHPTGGRVRIDFDFVGNCLIPSRYRYDPEFCELAGDSGLNAGNWGSLIPFPKKQ